MSKISKKDLTSSIKRHVKYTLGKEWKGRNQRDLYMALSLSLRDRMLEKMLKAEKKYQKADAKRLYYLSMEFLIGRSLGNNLLNLGLFDECKEAFTEMAVDLEEVRSQETDAALGNGGLGRLAACFLDSMATLGFPGFGYGIHYEYGLFRQKIEDGYQGEEPDHWLSAAGPLQFRRSENTCVIPIYGRIEHGTDMAGEYNPMWMDWKMVIGVPYDIPVAGYGGKTVNYLRLYAALPSSEFDIKIFNEGDYFRAVEQKIDSEKISKILYPADTFEAGRELRLAQEYFLVACALRDIVHRYKAHHDGFEQFADKVAIQLNDTHPALAVAELMRMLVDEEAVAWETAWEITQKTLAYTNHTLLPEALEKWPLHLMEHMLPRHVQIIFEINRRFLEDVASLWPGDVERLRRVSLIEEGGEKQVRMAHLAVVGSHSTNGVSALHSDLVKRQLFPEFNDIWPERFNNKTNGVTQRRWLLKANPSLSDLITRTTGEKWVTDLAELRRLEAYASDRPFQEAFLKVKRANKERLRRIVFDTTLIKVSPDTLFDIQAKRIHEYKRQLLMVMGIIHEYLCLVEDGLEPAVPKTHIFAGKAAPGYWAAKQIIKLIHSVGDVISRNPRVRDLIKVVFVPDYRVSLAERIIPAADLSEQISTAGKEASGTGNMKFAMNGALTIGTLDGANIEIMQEVGEENIYIFGLRSEEIQSLRAARAYRPRDYYDRHPEIARVLDSLHDDRFSQDEPGLFRWISGRLLDQGDEYFHLADFIPYLEARQKAEAEYSESAVWARKAILNVARMGKFSSDRAISEYAREIWQIRPV